MVRLFFELHDSTQVNRQGTYVGIQYRSEIFYANDEEKKIAEKVLDEMNKKPVSYTHLRAHETR